MQISTFKSNTKAKMEILSRVFTPKINPDSLKRDSLKVTKKKKKPKSKLKTIKRARSKKPRRIHIE
jgi:hypothetical protein